MGVAYPPPPSDAPARSKVVNAEKVLAVCRAVERLLPVREAFALQGYDSRVLGKWERNAELGEDPFWAWAVTCLRMANAESVRRATGALEERILDGDTRAITFFLQRRSEAFQDRKKVDVDVQHQATITHAVVDRANELLLKGEVTITDLANRRRAIAADDIIDAEVVEVEPEVHPLFQVKRPKED